MPIDPDSKLLRQQGLHAHSTADDAGFPRRGFPSEETSPIPTPREETSPIPTEETSPIPTPRALAEETSPIPTPRALALMPTKGTRDLAYTRIRARARGVGIGEVSSGALVWV